MLETAKKEGYAYPAVNVTTIEVINGALRAFSEAKSDGIIQVSIGGGKFASGSSVGNSALGAIVLAEATRRLAEKHNVLVALHTDHCQPEHVDTFLRPLIAESRRRVERGEAPLFNSHMLDASTLPMAENLKLSRELLKECAELGIVLEIEIGVVGGEEDGVDNSGHPADKLYTSPEDMLMTYEALAPLGKFMLAATFGNVHGVYKPGHVKLKPSILRDGQEAVVAKKIPRPPSPRWPMGKPSTAVAAEAGVPGIFIRIADWQPPEIEPMYTATKDRIANSGASL